MSRQENCVIAVYGKCGTGKTTLVKKLIKESKPFKVYVVGDLTMEWGRESESSLDEVVRDYNLNRISGDVNDTVVVIEDGYKEDTEIDEFLRLARGRRMKVFILDPNILSSDKIWNRIDYAYLFAGLGRNQVGMVHGNSSLTCTFEELYRVYEKAMEKQYSYLFLSTRSGVAQFSGELSFLRL